MNNEINTLTTTMIEDSSYFDDAKEWYASKYLYPYTQRTYTLIIAIAISIFTFLIIQIALLNNIKLKYSFPLYTDDQVEYYSKILPISKLDEPVSTSIARYFVTTYVKAYESYDFKIINDQVAWKELLRKIRELSSRKVFSNYVNYIDTSKNPESPILKYKSNIKRAIEIDKVQFPKFSDNLQKAKVYYKAIEKTDIRENITYWVAELTYSVTDINSILDKAAKLQFTITKYDTYELKYNNYNNTIN